MWGLYREKCGRWNVSVAWYQAVALMQVARWEGSVAVSAALERDVPWEKKFEQV